MFYYSADLYYIQFSLFSHTSISTILLLYLKITTIVLCPSRFWLTNRLNRNIFNIQGLVDPQMLFAGESFPLYEKINK